MSWSMSASIKPNDDVQAVLDARVEELNPAAAAAAYGAEAESAAQVLEACEVVSSLIYSGALGEPASSAFSVSISGHANPGHAPTSGWSNDVININVTRIAPPADVTAGAGGAEGVAH